MPAVCCCVVVAAVTVVVDVVLPVAIAAAFVAWLTISLHTATSFAKRRRFDALSVAAALVAVELAVEPSRFDVAAAFATVDAAARDDDDVVTEREAFEGATASTSPPSAATTATTVRDAF